MNNKAKSKSGFLAYVKRIFTERKRFDTSYLIALGTSIILALGVGALVMLAVGYNPIECYKEMIVGAFGKQRYFANTLAKSATLCITGIAMTIAAKAGMFNVGGEGQLFIGAIVSAIVGVGCANLPPFLAIIIALASAAAAGALLALFPAVLKIKLGISEVIVTILLNSAAIFFCSYLASGPFQSSEGTVAVGTEKLPQALKFAPLVRSSNLTGSIFIVAALTALTWYFLTKTSGGYEYKMTGLNNEFSRYSGLKNNRIALISMLISGAMCGLCGMFEVYVQGRFIPTISNEFYFDGMLVAMIMRYNPIGIVFMSLFFGMMKIGALQMELKTGISSELILVVQSIIIFFMAAENGITGRLMNMRRIREMKRSRISEEVQ